MALKKSGISPLNPSEVSDGMLAPAKVFKPSTDVHHHHRLHSPLLHLVINKLLCTRKDLERVMMCMIRSMSCGLRRPTLGLPRRIQ